MTTQGNIERVQFKYSIDWNYVMLPYEDRTSAIQSNIALCLRVIPCEKSDFFFFDLKSQKY